MANYKYRALIIEPSQIVAEGLEQMLLRSSHFLIADTLQQLPAKGIDDIDIVVVNPTLVANSEFSQLRERFASSKVVALLYSHLDTQYRGSFDDIIDIDTSEQQLVNQLLQLTQASEIALTSSNYDMGELSQREREILASVARGLLNKEIAVEHNISIHTVIAHRKNISRKTGIRSISGLVVYALFNNLIDESEVLQ